MTLTTKDLLAIEPVMLKNLNVKTPRAIKGVSTDSRTIKKGEVFVALRGDRFDGHNYLIEVFERGAICAVVDERMQITALKYPLIVVRDTTKALGDLANIYRRKFSLPVIAITGSAGKTTTKEMTNAILSSTFNVLSTKGNLNNHVGVPQTLFNLSEKHEIALIEMGMNHAGEIADLCSIAEPTHGLITNIGKAHLGFFKSVRKVATAKGELFQWLGADKDRTGIVNADDEHVVTQSKVLKKKISYGIDVNKADVRAEILSTSSDGMSNVAMSAPGWNKPIQVQMKIAGNHHAANAVAAASIGYAFGVKPEKIKSALEAFVPVGGRMEIQKVGGITVINDAYNANPNSMISALKTVAMMDCAGDRIAVLGDMLELGNFTESEHRRIGGIVNKLRFNQLLTYGQSAKIINEVALVRAKRHVTKKELIVNHLLLHVNPGDIVLFKASHSLGLGDVAAMFVEKLKEEAKSSGKQPVKSRAR